MSTFTRHEFPSFDGTAISWLDSGAGNAFALLLHGFLVDGELNFGSADQMAPLLRLAPPPEGTAAADPAGRDGVAHHLAAAGFRVLVPDMRGHGRSGKPTTTAGYHGRAMARDMILLLDRLGIDRCHVLGYSMGSVTTAHLIAEAPDRLQSAIFGGIGAAIVQGEEMVMPPELPIPASVPRPLTFARFAEYAAAIVDGSAPPEGMGAMYGVMADQLGMDRRVAAAVLRGHLSDAVEPAALRAFEGPMLVLNGDRDAGALPTEAAFGKYNPRIRFGRCVGDHLTAVLDPGFQRAVLDHFRGTLR